MGQKTNRGNKKLWAIAGGSALAIYAVVRSQKLAGADRGQHSREYTAQASFTLNCSQESAYRFWRDFENLPLFMNYLESVKVNGNTSEWTALGPLGSRVCWTAEIAEDRANEYISWRSLPGSQLDNRGSVSFRPATSGRGTVVSATLSYAPPAGTLGHAAAMLAGKHPEFTLREDLRRFKALLETGEVSTIAGQPHGPRGLGGGTEQVLLREKQNMPSPQAERPLRRTA